MAKKYSFESRVAKLKVRHGKKYIQFQPKTKVIQGHRIWFGVYETTDEAEANHLMGRRGIELIGKKNVMLPGEDPSDARVIEEEVTPVSDLQKWKVPELREYIEDHVDLEGTAFEGNVNKLKKDELIGILQNAFNLPEE